MQNKSDLITLYTSYVVPKWYVYNSGKNLTLKLLPFHYGKIQPLCESLSIETGRVADDRPIFKNQQRLRKNFCVTLTFSLLLLQ